MGVYMNVCLMSLSVLQPVECEQDAKAYAKRVVTVVVVWQVKTSGKEGFGLLVHGSNCMNVHIMKGTY